MQRPSLQGTRFSETGSTAQASEAREGAGQRRSLRPPGGRACSGACSLGVWAGRGRLLWVGWSLGRLVRGLSLAEERPWAPEARLLSLGHGWVSWAGRMAEGVQDGSGEVGQGAVRETVSLTWGPREGEIKSGLVLWPQLSPRCCFFPVCTRKRWRSSPARGGRGGGHTRWHPRPPPGAAVPPAPTRTSSKTKLLLPRKEGLLPEGPPEQLGVPASASGMARPGSWGGGGGGEGGEDATKPPALYGRSGYHSAPQTRLSPIPMAFPPAPPAPAGLHRGPSVRADQTPQPGAQGPRWSPWSWVTSRGRQWSLT